MHLQQLLPDWHKRKTRVAVCAVVLGTAALVWGAPRAWTHYHLARARSALSSRDAEAAIAHLGHAGRFAANDGERHFLLGRAWRRLGRFDLVADHLQRAWNSGFDRERIQREQWLALAQAGQLSRVERHLRKLLIDQRGDGPEICEAFVDGYFATYRFDQAFSLLRAWEESFPNDAQPHVFRGLFHEHRHRSVEAAESYRRALQLAPERHDVRFRLARQLAALREYDEAAEQFRRCLDQRPDDPDVRCAWGECLAEMGQSDEARQVFEGILRQHPEHYDTRLALGRLELAAPRIQEALAHLAPLAAARPTDSEARYVLAQALQADGQAEAAKEHFQFVAEARERLAEIQRLTDQVQNSPDDVDLRYRIGTGLLKYDVPEHGAAWLRSVLEIDAYHRPTHAVLADYYSSAGNAKLAEHHRLLAARGERR